MTKLPPDTREQATDMFDRCLDSINGHGRIESINAARSVVHLCFRLLSCAPRKYEKTILLAQEIFESVHYLNESETQKETIEKLTLLRSKVNEIYDYLEEQKK